MLKPLVQNPVHHRASSVGSYARSVCFCSAESFSPPSKLGGVFSLRTRCTLPVQEFNIRNFIFVLLILSVLPAQAAFVERSDLFPQGTLLFDYSSWADFNNDGWPDIYDSAGIRINEGGTNFTTFAGYGRAVHGDIDNDGFIDILDYDVPVRALINDGTGTSFSEIPFPVLPLGDLTCRGASLGDQNNDGYIDVYVGGYENTAGSLTFQDTFVWNNAGASFSAVSSTLQYRARGITSCDFDEDGDLDIYVSNYRLQPNVLWQNNGAGGFANVAAPLGADGQAHTIGSAWGDFNNDGRFDILVGNFAHPGQPQSQFLENQGPAGGWTFVDRANLVGLQYQETYASPALADYDNDGNLDFFLTVVNTTGGADTSVLFRNLGGWNFQDVTAAEGLAGITGIGGGSANYNASWGDFDLDGDLDLITQGRLYENQQSTGNHWLRVRLEGDGVTVNRSAIGAQVRIQIGGETQSGQVEAGTGEGNANDLVIHFGLGSRTAPVDLEVLWPGGLQQTVIGVAVDQTFVVSSELSVNNAGGATDITTSSATLNGLALVPVTGTLATACVYWGPNDAGPTSNWPNVECIHSVSTGPISIPATNLVSNTQYFYRWNVTTAADTAWSEAAATFASAGDLPFTETFESLAVGDIHLQRGWLSSPSNAAVVQTTSVHTGVKAAGLHNAVLDHPFSAGSGDSIYYTDFHAIPNPGEGPFKPNARHPNAAAMFYVDTFTTNDPCLVVFDGQTKTAITTGPVFNPGVYHRYTVRTDFQNKIWDLWMDGVIVARNLGFFNPAVTGYGRIRIDDEHDTGETSIDDITIRAERPFDIPFIDDDLDNLDDDWERKHFGSTTVSDGSATADQDLDNFIDLHEFMAGTNPTNLFSFLSIDEIRHDAPSNVVVTWGSEEHRVYDLNATTNPISAPYTPVQTDIPATPPMNQETISVDQADSHFNIRLVP
jgi:hypothetical protein